MLDLYNQTTVEEVDIDRDEENEKIAEYQDTNDLAILQEVYLQRVPTLKHWTVTNWYPGLALSADDFFAELTLVFLKAANYYNRERGSFNTCLYTFLVNRIKNMKNARHAKKRSPKEYDGPLSSLLLSLDYEYYEKDGHSVKLSDLIEQDAEDHEGINEIQLHDILRTLSDGDDALYDVLLRISKGSTISGALRPLKVREGHVQYNGKDIQEEDVRRLISENLGSDKFKIMSYSVNNESISFRVEMKKTQEFAEVNKKLKRIRRQKDRYMDMLGV